MSGPTPDDIPEAPHLDLSFQVIYDALLGWYGPQHWWPAETDFEVIVGAILTQNTAWTNVERAIKNLRDADALTPSALRMLPLDRVAELVRPSGYFNMKAKKLRAMCEYLGTFNDDLSRLFASKPLAALRTELLRIYGVGEETADSILLYAGRLPSFVVDAYTERVVRRLGALSDGPYRYREIQALLDRGVLEGDYGEFHALFVIHGKDTCRSRAPRCGNCPLTAVCATGVANIWKTKTGPLRHGPSQ
ncbi:MAG: hypothetical protein O3B84_06795 [Chloroflexi bacterium]|nr:hypothetical protein [Chloroflexota bacterium]